MAGIRYRRQGGAHPVESMLHCGIGAPVIARPGPDSSGGGRICDASAGHVRPFSPSTGVAYWNGVAHGFDLPGVRGTLAWQGGLEILAEHRAPYFRDCGWLLTVYCHGIASGKREKDAWKAFTASPSTPRAQARPERSIPASDAPRTRRESGAPCRPGAGLRRRRRMGIEAGDRASPVLYLSSPGQHPARNRLGFRADGGADPHDRNAAIRLLRSDRCVRRISGHGRSRHLERAVRAVAHGIPGRRGGVRGRAGARGRY